MNNVWLSLRDAQSPVLYQNPDAELPARFVMSIGDALPAASGSLALPARTVTITKGSNYHLLLQAQPECMSARFHFPAG